PVPFRAGRPQSALPGGPQPGRIPQPECGDPKFGLERSPPGIHDLLRRTDPDPMTATITYTDGRTLPESSVMGARAVRTADLCVARSGDGFGGLVVGGGVPRADVYLEFLGGRCRPNTVLAAAYDLKVFFTIVARPPGEVRPADVLAFITAQRTGRAGEHGVLQPLDGEGEPAGVSSATVRRRLSVVSGFFAFLQARGDVTAN